MAKNLVRNNKQPIGMEKDAKNVEAMAASPNLVKGFAYEAPLMVNEKRDRISHMGAMPKSGSGKF